MKLNPSLPGAVVLLLGAGLPAFFLVSPRWVAIYWVAVLGFIGCLALGDWAWKRAAVRLRETHLALAVSVETLRLEKTLEVIDRLEHTPELVLQVFATHPALALAITGNTDPIARLVTAKGDVPYSFIDRWFGVNEQLETLRPINTWPRQGMQMQYASWLEHHLIAHGYLVRWNGNGTARWASDAEKQRFVTEIYGERILRRSVPGELEYIETEEGA
jgi:hypothetical protein